jgi:hypothetical protein
LVSKYSAKLLLLPALFKPKRMAKGSCNRMGELEPWIDEAFIRSIWFGMGEQVNVKMIRDKFSGYVVGCDAILIMKKKLTNQ